MATRNQRRRAMREGRRLQAFLRREGLWRVPRNEGTAIEHWRARCYGGILVRDNGSYMYGAVILEEGNYAFQPFPIYR